MSWFVYHFILWTNTGTLIHDLLLENQKKLENPVWVIDLRDSRGKDETAAMELLFLRLHKTNCEIQYRNQNDTSKLRSLGISSMRNHRLKLGRYSQKTECKLDSIKAHFGKRLQCKWVKWLTPLTQQ